MNKFFLRLLQNQNKRHKKKHKRHKKKTSNFSFLDDLLCDELLEQILCRLELKTVHRCKSVCKRWLSLVSSAEFIDQYVRFQQSVSPTSSRFYLAFELQRQASRHSSYRLDIGKAEASSSSSSSKSFDFDTYPKHTTRRPWVYYSDLIGSWNGLVLCQETFEEFLQKPRYSVCNPITRDWLVLPPYEFKGSHQAGFIDDDDGLITTTRGFKVALVEVDQNKSGVGNYLNISVFSSCTGEWRSQRVLCREPVFFAGVRGLFSCNRMLYWGNVKNPNFIIGYDTSKMPPPDECTYIDLPPEYKERERSFHAVNDGLFIGVSQGRILICETLLEQSQPLCIWELQDCTTSSWRLKHKLVVDSVLNRRIIVAFHPIDGDIVYLAKWKDGIHSLNMKNKKKQIVENTKAWRCAVPFFLPWWQARLQDQNNSKQT
ncbi:hypothetical protein Tsubulata_051571 [Turnera subulata]|uniref:F-box domain-containing protein n=1 Tax=Turnera subulata TaxID=218843 RepID=A0A9Q0GKK2_9ROSI|nr:hypothetical protein Tsubulata_051571 [Turnera subulata]